VRSNFFCALVPRLAHAHSLEGTLAAMIKAMAVIENIGSD